MPPPDARLHLCSERFNDRMIGAPDTIGIAFPGGKTPGNAAAVMLHFDLQFMRLAADGKL